MKQNLQSRNKPQNIQKMDCDEGAKAIYRGRIAFITNGARTTEYPYAKKILFDSYIVPYNKIN